MLRQVYLCMPKDTLGRAKSFLGQVVGDCRIANWLLDNVELCNDTTLQILSIVRLCRSANPDVVMDVSRLLQPSENGQKLQKNRHALVERFVRLVRASLNKMPQQYQMSIRMAAETEGWRSP